MKVLKDFFDDKTLIDPMSRSNSVDLARVLARRSGAPCPKRRSFEAEWEKLFRALTNSGSAPSLTEFSSGDLDNGVFILLDGLGMNTRPWWPKGGFFETFFKREYLAVYPSTTVCALSALSSGEQAGQLGLTGWDTCLPERDTILTVLPMQDRESGRFLKSSELSIDDVILKKSIRDSFKPPSCVISPGQYKGSQYTLWTGGRCRIRGYQSLKEAFSLTVLEALSPGVTYTYLPQLDHEEHVAGPFSAQVIKMIQDLDNTLSALRERMPSSVPLMVTTDHGQIEVKTENQIWLDSDHEIMYFLRFPPSGEAVGPVFFVKPGRHEKFVRWFDAQWSDEFLLLPSDEIFTNRLLGPEDPFPVTKERWGDFTALATGKSALRYQKPGGKKIPMTGFHGGLRPAEMEIPFFMA